MSREEGAGLHANSVKGISSMTAEEAFRLLFPDSGILAEVEWLRLAGGHRLRGTMAGKRRSSMLGGSQEFADYRPYAPGDDIRRLDWNVYGRTGRAYIRQYWDEQELHATMYVDGSLSMTFSGGAASTKLQVALRLASLISYAALAGEDRVEVRLFDQTGMADSLPPLHGRPSFMKLYRFMAEYYSGGVHSRRESRENGNASHSATRTTQSAVSDLSMPFREPGALPRRPGVSWLFTDAMFEKGIEETLLTLAAAGQRVVWVQLLSPEEVHPSWVGELNLIDSELATGKEVAVSERLLKQYRNEVAAYKDKLRNLCSERGAAYSFVDTSMPMQQIIRELVAQQGVLVR
ncbi:DUF58 domain-containing protein [Paenibacillus paeoniae]|uniref:DUF58 domain-containing protein n=1 Tax=Paenibacillus paeoniae TaxID=2292705 RepID=A0A371PK79_9BACL|nr:DUF58 domain-containing protein [Paenibacillus paeoniae]REK76606.1 DUF58 domain-containing protein [Paenibacillus paeoniae]